MTPATKHTLAVGAAALGSLALDVAGRLTPQGASVATWAIGALGLSAAVKAFRSEGGPLVSLEEKVAPLVAEGAHYVCGHCRRMCVTCCDGGA